MRFTLASGELNNRLQTLAKAINSKNSLPILECFLFEVANGTLTITASDSENIMQSTLTLAEWDGEGRFALPNRTILDAVKELADQPLTFNVNSENYAVSVMYQNGIYNLTAQNAEEYPVTVSALNEAHEIIIDAQVLNDNIIRSLFATAQDELRPVMNGIYFDLTPESLSIVASDGHKLVRNRYFGIHADQPASFILPKKPAVLLKTVLGKVEGSVAVRFDERTAEVTYGDGKLSCRLIEGRYPNYNSVIPANNPNALTIDRRSLIGAIRRVLPFASESSQLIKLHLEPGKLELASEDVDFATSARENITCEYNGQVMNIGFKGSSLSEILNNLSSDEVTLKLADPSRAGIVLPAQQPDSAEVLMLIMPMLLND